jgi:hypothetical protein
MLVHGGVETLTITDATPGTRVAVHDQEGTPLVTLVADEQGSTPDLPPRGTRSSTRRRIAAPSGGRTRRAVPAGTGGGGPKVDVLGVHDADPGATTRNSPGYGYLTMRDGVQLSSWSASRPRPVRPAPYPP